MKLIGTAIAPRRLRAKYAITKTGLLRWMIATQSPFLTPAFAKPAAAASTCSRSAPKVVTSPSRVTSAGRFPESEAAASSRSFNVFMVSRLSRVENVPPAVAEKVPAEHEQKDRRAGNEDRMPVRERASG